MSGGLRLCQLLARSAARPCSKSAPCALACRCTGAARSHSSKVGDERGGAARGPREPEPREASALAQAPQHDHPGIVERLQQTCVFVPQPAHARVTSHCSLLQVHRGRG